MDNIANTTNFNNHLFMIIGIIAVGLVLLYFILKPKKYNTGNTDSTKSLKPKSEKIPTFELKVKKPKVDVKKEFKASNETIISNTTKKEPNEILIEPIEKVETPIKLIEIVIPEEEEQSKEKYIGYNPINVFAQTEPLSFPYVIMPQPNCVIKFPRKGRSGRKGHKEEAFKAYIEEYFRNSYQIYDDRFVLIKNSSKPYEPDFSLINEKNGINIFLDIEIDEPYEGTNDIKNRKATHYQHADSNRNNAFKNRGWIVIRFAEIQVHQQPDTCCKFIADVLKSIDSTYTIPERLSSIKNIDSIPQWTKEEAEQWSLEKYRERYLGILKFGITTNSLFQEAEETELGEVIEKFVIDEKIITVNELKEKLNNFHKIYMASVTGKYISFSSNDKKTVFKPININDIEASGFCYVKNEVKTFTIAEMENVEIKNNYYTQQIAGHLINVTQISNIVNTAIDYQKYIRMKYTRSGWRSVYVDTETGEMIENKIMSEESIRTISDVQLSINALDQEHIQNYRLNNNYLTAYCHKREEQRTFKFDRISVIEILDL